ncbi:MAG: bilirubin oxidase [Candidatus Methylomirabilota bacterium]|nr:bilirubin oxidase [candidate division NC10 bacterium]PWB47294.1 MAG: bilirubin oxidase [candidate division NC10 bacterium]
MSLHILKPVASRKEKLVGRYIQQVREIAKARLSRRELLRMGLVMSGGGLAGLHGLGNARLSWAHSESESSPVCLGIPQDVWINDPTTLISPRNTPFVDPLPIPPVVQTTILNPTPTKGPNLVASAVTGFTEAPRPDHQRWEEFGGSATGPGFSGPQYELIEQAISHNYYPAVDGVPPGTIWAFVDATNGNAGALRIKARYGEPVVVRIHNALSNLNDGFGCNQTSTHLHNGHTASESDGGPFHFYQAGQFKDFHHASVRAGFASTHPTSNFNGRTVPGDVRETMSFLWLHDHRVGFTAQNVYKGLAMFYHLFSDDIDLDTDDETTGLRLPSGEFDIPMILTDKVFDPTTGQLFFDLFNLDGILGDKFAVNGKIQPFLEVKRRRYRFRILDGGPSRVYELFLSNGRNFIQLSNDGNLLPRALARRSITLGVAERVDVIVDFTDAQIGERIYLQNRLEQLDGRGPTGKLIEPTNLVEFRVEGDAADDSRAYQEGEALLPLPDLQPVARERRFAFDRSNGAWTINGEFVSEDLNRPPNFRLPQDTAEIWTLTSAGGWQHPVHPHQEEFILLERDGKAVPIDEVARKDIVRIGMNAGGRQNSGKAKFFRQFRDWFGDYPMHCHNTLHEDHAMMLLFEVVP